MKKPVAFMGAAMFGVVCFSLYLMMETANLHNQMSGLDEMEAANIDNKIRLIQKDLDKNKKTIILIKDTVKQLSKGDKSSIERLKNALDIDMDQKEKEKDLAKQKPKTDISKAVAKVSQDMCTFAERPPEKTEVQMLDVFDILPFDNPDGGAWKQGFPISYDTKQWEGKPLKVFLMPHTHCDPGWIKTFDAYYRDQTRHILNLMVDKLEVDKTRRFSFAEMSFFSRWWSDIGNDVKERVKRLINNGQLEILAGGWVMTDEANAHYFAMIDQLIEGHQFLEDQLGVKPKSGWAIDPFGQSPTMAYILKRAGFNNMLIQRVHYSVKKYLASKQELEFLWRQNWDHDGSTDMLCHMMPFYSYDVPHTCGPDPRVCCQFDFKRLPGGRITCPWRIPPVPITQANVEQKASQLLDQYRKKATLYKNNVLLVILGDDFRYDKPIEWDQQFTNYQKLFDYMNGRKDWNVEARFGTLSEYFAALHERAGSSPGDSPPDYPHLSGDFFTYSDREDNYWSGYYTSRPLQKHLDRIMESHLRKAEILYTQARAQAKQLGIEAFPADRLMTFLTNARRQLGLFQHHDGITGTAKDHVVVDYGNRLLVSLNDMKRVINNAAHFLLLKDKTSYNYKKLFEMDEDRPAHDSLPTKTVISVTENPRRVVLYNSLSQERSELVRLYVSTPYVEVTDEEGRVVDSQTDLYWVTNDESSTEVYKVVFVAKIPALGLTTYKIRKVAEGENNKNTHSTITLYNAQSTGAITRGPFHIYRKVAESFSIENTEFKADFSNTGMIKSLTNKDGVKTDIDLNFVKYGTRRAKEKSGAYLFLPDGEAQLIDVGQPFIRVIQGQLLSEVHVFISHVEHVVRLVNSPGTDGSALSVSNIVDIRNEMNYELAMRFKTSVKNHDGEFFTDLNGFQVQRRKTFNKLPLQANFYPMPTMAYIQDDRTRFSVLTAGSLGVASLKQGWIEVMLDRRLGQDDNRGLMQGVKDNRRTPNSFRIHVEHTQGGKQNPVQPMGYPSLLGHLSSLSHIHPVHVLPHAEEDSSQLMSSYTPLKEDLPCELHMLNFRTFHKQEAVFSAQSSAALLLHRLNFDCSYPASGSQCKTADGKVSLGNLFKNINLKRIASSSLSFMHEQEELDISRTIQVKPMEINAYRVDF